MNYQNFNQAGGFPLETENLQEMQSSYSIFNSLGAIAGELSIIKGCTQVGNVVADGVVCINGEVIDFKGGQVGTNVVIVEEIIQKEFEDGNNKGVFFNRYATFGIATTVYPWANFKRPKSTIELTEEKADQSVLLTLIERIEQLEARPVANVPVGMIAIWDRPANEIPQGWVEYQPLRGRMPIGLNPDDNDLDNLGVAVGSRYKTLVSANIPKLDFQDRGVQQSGNTDDSPGGGTPYYTPNTQANSVGSNTPTSVDVLNPARVVHFIKYVG